MPTLSSLRVSRNPQEVAHHRLAMLELARCRRTLDTFIQLHVSSRRSPKERQADLLVAHLVPGETFIVSELSRLGRGAGKSITLAATPVQRQPRLLPVKEGIRRTGR